MTPKQTIESPNPNNYSSKLEANNDLEGCFAKPAERSLYQEDFKNHPLTPVYKYYSGK
jgi:hypothetical protein